MNLTVKPRLLAILKELGITQMQLSAMTGVPQGSISRFDRNESHVDWHVFAIATALELRIEDLFEITQP